MSELVSADGGKASANASSAHGDVRRGPFARLSLFVRQVVAELKKVVWPTRKEMVTYTSVVIAFVAIMMTFVTIVDLGVGKLTFWIFGG